MQLPSADNGKTHAPQNAEFPHTFPSHYIKLLTIQTGFVEPYMHTLTCIFINPCVYVHIHTYIDAKKAALNKLAKLFYFLTCKCEVAVPAEMIIGIMTTTSIATYSHTHGYKLILLTRGVCVRSDGTNFDAGIECAYRGIQPPS